MSPYISNFEVCGGLRREKNSVHDVDIVIQIKPDGYELSWLLPSTLPVTKYKIYKDKLKFMMDGIPVETYIAYTPQQFEVYKLVRTGDWKFNKTLCDLAFMMQKPCTAFRFSGKYYGLYSVRRLIDKTRGDQKKKKIIDHIFDLLAYKEEDIITRVFGKYIPPVERSYADVQVEDISNNAELQEIGDKRLGITEEVPIH